MGPANGAFFSLARYHIKPLIVFRSYLFSSRKLSLFFTVGSVRLSGYVPNLSRFKWFWSSSLWDSVEFVSTSLRLLT